MKWSLVFKMFRSVELEHLERSIYTVSRQTVAPSQFIFFDNNSPFSIEEITNVVCQHVDTGKFESEFHFVRHEAYQIKTLSWAGNRAIRAARHPIFVMMRADCVYRHDFCEQMLGAAGDNPMCYATPWYTLLDEQSTKTMDSLPWRENVDALSACTGNPMRAEVAQDGPSFCTNKLAMAMGGWYDEALVGWGFDQQDLQKQMVNSGVAMKVVPEMLYYHMCHSIRPEQSERDMARALLVWSHSPRRSAEL